MRRYVQASAIIASLGVALLLYWTVMHAGPSQAEFRPPSPAAATQVAGWGPGGSSASEDVPSDLAGWPKTGRAPLAAGPFSGGSMGNSWSSIARGSSTETSGTVLMNGREYQTNSQFCDRLDDPHILGPFSYAYTLSPLWRKVADSAGAQGTGIRWGALDKEVNSLFSPNDNTITLNSDLKSEPGQVVSAVLAHETYHASHNRDSGVGAQLQEEINAYAWEAYVWSQIPRHQPRTPREAYLDNLVRLWQSHELNDFVVTLPGYQQSIFGRVLESP